eukprot:TRINITY_DN10722_c0_g1_i1.p1 TRINITY_DN10722_c0_g1~~TRINITY_DN10722_c0_g1_i1.p1  ORF type:complete len:310 (+),score=60.60 TRINITY_DN10722_c0_g1_i1:575-1504(+)
MGKTGADNKWTEFSLWFTIPPSKRVSFSHLKKFHTCGLQYLYAYCLSPKKITLEMDAATSANLEDGVVVSSTEGKVKVTTKEKKMPPSKASLMGNEAHDIASQSLEQLNEHIKKVQNDKNKTSKDKKTLVSIARNVKGEVIAQKKEEEKVQAEYELQKEKAVKANLPPPPKPPKTKVHKEFQFTFPFDNSEIQGSIDRLEVFGDQYRIIEHKAFKRSLENPIDSLQGLIYVLAIKKLYSTIPTLTFHTLNSSRKLTWAPSQDDLTIGEFTLGHLIENIHKPTGPSPNNCFKCEFREACPFSRSYPKKRP